MTLRKWMAINKISTRQMAEILTKLRKDAGYETGIYNSMIHNWATGKCKPRLDNIKLIKLATQGRVSFTDF